MKSTPSGSVQSETTTPPSKPSPPLETSTPPKAAAPTSPAKPASPATPAVKPTVPAAGHPAPPKPAGPVPTPWDSPLVAKLKGEYGSGIEPLTHLGQNYMVVDRSLIPEILQVLRDQEQFDYCVDITAVHYPKREKQFDVVWVLYSFAQNARVRVKTQIAEAESIASSVPLWAT